MMHINCHRRECIIEFRFLRLRRSWKLQWRRICLFTTSGRPAKFIFWIRLIFSRYEKMKFLSKRRKSKSVAPLSFKVTMYPYAMASIGQNNFIIRVNTRHGMNQSVNKIVGLRWKFQFRKRANVVVHLDDLQTVNFNISFRESSEC